MPTTTPLLDILLTIHDIATDPKMTTERLAMRRACSERHAKRYIAEARHLGADIQSVRTPDGYVWRVGNWDAIRDRLTTWIDLEKSRSLV